ncbi:MAG: rubrerythrin family protein [Bacteroidetes bacterium 4572_77]|nr:MAG: rubrerythrin family protein [Bacteroidetes bacterium 4572_77]
MANLKGTKTEQNLLKAFAGESQAKNRYEFAARQAEKEGYQQIANIFRETALNEYTHAKKFFDFLEGGTLEITTSYPAGITLSTEENLKAAAKGENEEWTGIYPHFADIAVEEGFKEVSTAFKMVAKAEAHHEKRFLALVNNLQENLIFEREEKVDWICLKCGYVHLGKKAPNICPCCDHSQKWFEIRKLNY